MEQPPLYNDSFSEFEITPYSSSLQQLANLPSPTHEEPSSLDSTGNTPYPTNDDLVPPPYEAESSDNQVKFADLTPSLLDQQTPSPISPPPQSQTLYQQPIQRTAENAQRTNNSLSASTNQTFPSFPSTTPRSPVQQSINSLSPQSRVSQVHSQPSMGQMQSLQQAQIHQQQELIRQHQQQQQQQQQELVRQQQQQQEIARQQQQQQQELLRQQQQQEIARQQQQQAQLHQQQELMRQQQQRQSQPPQNQVQSTTQHPFAQSTVQSHPIQNNISNYELQQSYGYPVVQTGSVYPSIPQVQSVQNLYGQNSSQQTKDALNQIQTYFDKISGFMERLDRRMAALEVTAQTIAKNQGQSDVRSDVNSLKKLHTQVESDFDVAKRLQDELNQKYEKEKRREEKKKAKAASQAKLSSSVSTPRPPTTSSNSSVQECPICAVKVPIADLEVHVNACLEGTEKPMDSRTPDNGDKPSIWKRVFGPGPKKDETPSPPSTAIVPANRMPGPPPVRTVSTPVYGQDYYPQPQQGAYVYRPYGQPVPPQVYGYPNQQPVYYYNPNMPPKR
eukprot:TRINITY_DN377_c0_g4_i1.p1 TRINITY_DN377_c0_g4~~TRINITY_DN377_c0_g4_i1.p1  ORF type:complete len:559 (+),score=187.44 TRINITY_DN377_c0_g4_i1:158-1834(+)